MLELIRSAVGVIEDGALFIVAVLVIIRLIGGRRGLRNPWVYGPILFSAGAFFLGLYLAYRADHRPPGFTPGPGGSLAAIFTYILIASIFTGPIIAAVAGARRGSKINRLLHVPDMGLDLEHAREDTKRYTDTVRTRAESLVSRDDLEALLPLVDQMGGAPGYDWLTVEWIRERMSALPPHTGPQLKEVEAYRSRSAQSSQ